jgi:hypothetical protein
MAKMFQMMNDARIACCLQALGIVASAYDTARNYAKERIQGPPFTNHDADRVPIIQHEDVRRLLMNLKAGSEAMRAIICRLLFLMDVSRYDPDETVRIQAGYQVELLTPLVKAYSSDFGYQLTRDAIQILAGVGFCNEFPVEQYARDIKIVSIWEGTSYIQSLDLVGRKLRMEGGKVFQDWIQDTMSFTGEHKDDEEFGPDFKLLFKAAQAVGDFAMRYMQYVKERRLALIPLSSNNFLDCCAEIAMAQLMLEQGLIAREKLAGVEANSADGIFYRGKVETAKYFCRNILPNVFSRHTALVQEDTSALDIPEEAF